jgi:XisI protein
LPFPAVDKPRTACQQWGSIPPETAEARHRAAARPVAEELMAAGAPREDIVVGFRPARFRQLTGFAVG